MARSLFPHLKLDWNIKNLREQLDDSERTARERRRDNEDETGPDATERMALARHLIARAFFHGGGEQAASEALQLCRKVLTSEPAHPEALVLAGFALLSMNRPDGAEKYFDQAVEADTERADLRLGMGCLARERIQRGQAVRELEFACRIAPDSWEANLFLGRALAELARPQGNPRRIIERSQYHLIRALKLEPPPDVLAALLKDIGISCMLTGRYREAERFFVRLREHETYAPAARYFLGQVAYQLGKYHNAIQHYRQVLRTRPDDPKVLARMGMAWFQLGELAKAREASHQAMLLDPDNLAARHALGCALLEEGNTTEALKTFRETLRDHPSHLPSYIEMVRTRRLGGDQRWLVQALHSEVGTFDRLPHGGEIDPRDATRARIQVVLDELRTVGPSTVRDILAAIDLSQDEGVRFMLWEAALGMSIASVADDVATKLREPGEHYGVDLGIEAIATASALPDPVLVGGLSIDEEDLKRNAVNRHGPTSDVAQHRARVEQERVQARTYQALGLVALASRRSATGKAILKKWGDSGDPDLTIATLTGLALYGDPEAADQLLSRAASRGAAHHVQHLLDQVTPPEARTEPEPVTAGGHTQCSTCGRGPSEIDHMMVGGGAVICDRCVLRVSQHRRSLPAPDGAMCNLCGRSPFEVTGLYAYNNTAICSACIERSLGLLEREEVARFLASY